MTASPIDNPDEADDLDGMSGDRAEGDQAHGQLLVPDATPTWTLAYGARRGRKTEVTIGWGGRPRQVDNIDLTSGAARERFAKAAARAAGLDPAAPAIDRVAVARGLAERACLDSVAEAAAGAADGPDRAPDLPTLANHVEGSPRAFEEIDESLDALAGGWPRRIGNTLFAEADDHRPIYLRSATQLFAWIDRRARVDWAQGPRMISQERYFEGRRMQAEEYDTIETMPHTPSVAGACYMHPPLPAASGKLDELVGRFSPGSDIDRSLLYAAILTPSWGAPGARPAFLVVGPDDDPGRGRGVGKSSLVDLIADDLHGGSIAVSPTEDIVAIKKRLFSPGAASRRILRLDNVKTYRFSWADLEDLLTATTISGTALYTGEGRLPNRLTCFITLNGAGLSKDMAQRVVMIKLARPSVVADRDRPWGDEVREFIRANRWEILGDIAAVLGRPPGALRPEPRWEAWEQDILSKVARAEDCRAAIRDRQAAIDEDDNDRDLIYEHIFEQIRKIPADPETANLEIPSRLMARWVGAATDKHFPTNTATAFVRGLGIEELKQSRKTGNFRGWAWTGRRAPQGKPTRLSPPEDREAAEVQQRRPYRQSRSS